VTYFYEYEPIGKAFIELHSKLCSVCDDLGVRITNVVKRSNQYYIVYYMKTSGRFSQLMFYFNNKGFITRCMPSSDMGQEDTLLQNVIKELN